jgi:AcrR family transcriptional regulator
VVVKEGANQTDSRQDQILEGAAELFASRGYRTTSVGDIGDAVGMSGPALYRHFPNKQSMLDAICLAGMRSLLDSARTIVAAGKVPTVTLDNLIRMRVEFAFGLHRFTFLIYRNEEGHLSARANRQMSAMHDLYRAEWVRVLTNVRPAADTVELQVAWLAAHALIGYTSMNDTGNDEHDFKEHLFRMAKAVLLA